MLAVEIAVVGSTATLLDSFFQKATLAVAGFNRGAAYVAPLLAANSRDFDSTSWDKVLARPVGTTGLPST